MNYKNKFADNLKELLLGVLPIFKQDIVDSCGCKDFLEWIKEAGHKLEMLPADIVIRIDRHKKNLAYIRSVLNGESARELSRVPFDTSQPVRGNDLLQLTVLLFIETLDQYYVCTLKKHSAQITLDQFLCYQNERYGALNKKIIDNN